MTTSTMVVFEPTCKPPVFVLEPQQCSTADPAILAKLNAVSGPAQAETDIRQGATITDDDLVVITNDIDFHIS